MQAIRPTHATRPGAQTWVWSTRGDRNLTWFHGLIEQGYAGLPGVALFDFGIPDDADPMDLDVIERYHPAAGYTIEREFLASEQAGMADTPGEFARAYGNRATGALERVIPAAALERRADHQPLPAGPPGLRHRRRRGRQRLHPARRGRWTRPGARCRSRWSSTGPAARGWSTGCCDLRDAGQGVAVDRRGPAAPVADALELRGVELLQLGTHRRRPPAARTSTTG
jgi:hypothetical protein